jgi:quinoprotein relay system zinc metallohydrolase 2
MFKVRGFTPQSQQRQSLCNRLRADLRADSGNAPVFCPCCPLHLTRRRLIASAAALALGGAAAALPMQEVAPGIFVRRGEDADATAANGDAIANIGFVIGRDAIAVIDPGGSGADGARLLAAIRARSERPIRYVIASHVHLDHIFGANAFRAEGVEFIGHARLPAALAARGAFYRQHLVDLLGPTAAGDFVPPTRLVEDELRLDLGDRVLEITAHPPAHTDTDLTVRDGASGTFWAADLLFVGRIPVLDGSLTGWLATLAALKQQAARRAVPGHGPVSVAWPEAAADEERYLATLAREVRALIAKGVDIEIASREVGYTERDKWRLFDDYNARNVIEAYKELEWE